MGDEQVLYVRNAKDFRDDESSSTNDDPWDDTALIDAYEQAVGLAKDQVEQRMNGNLYEQNASYSECSLSNEALDVPTSRQLRVPHKNKNAKKTDVCPVQWSEGDPCRCLYSADGRMYEAHILKISHGGSCTVKYVGYENEEDTYLSVLSPSHGEPARTKQVQAALLENVLITDVNPNISSVEHLVEPRAPKRKGKRSPKVPQNPQMEWESLDHPRSQTSSRQGNRSQPSPRQRQNYSMAMPQLPQMMVPPPPPLNLLAAAGCPNDESDALSAMLMSWYMSGFHTGYYQGMKSGKEQAVPQQLPRNPPRKR